MRRSIQAGPGSSMFSRQGLPLFATYLIWGTGSGAQTLGRSLFAFELSNSIFLVTLIFAALGASRIFSAPLTGFLADRVGRKPLAVIGAGLRGGASFGVLYIDSYAAFFVLELIGNTGVAMWQTTSQVVIADMSTPENRGRAVAMRNSSMRLGQLIGPVLGGFIAVTWGLPQVFVVNGVSKFLVMFITLYLIGETRPTRERRPAAERTSLRADLLPIVLSRAFLALGLTTIAAALIGQSMVQAMFPIAGKVDAGLIESEIGLLITVAGIVTLLCSFPNGVLVDRLGRKMSLVPGLLIAAGAAVVLSMMDGFSIALLGMAVLGMAIAMTMGSTQAFAMDLAPDDKRGAFLGLWASFQSFGSAVGPLAAGAIAEFWGFGTAFIAVAGFLVFCALAMAMFGPETRARSRRDAGTSAGTPGRE
ncbi:MAG: MFS transporter [Chloroflexi bacterium]|nr:MFS transporter [Chloroflexota bacterium]